MRQEMLRAEPRAERPLKERPGSADRSPATVPDSVRARSIKLVGQYAIQIDWSDGHSTGLYNFRDLRAGCPCEACEKLRKEGKTPG